MKQVILIFFIGALLLFAGCSSETTTSTQTELIKVKIASLPVVQGLPVYLAYEKGYFKDAGLDVELVKIDAPNLIIDALLSGQIDMTSPSGALGIAGIANHKNPGKIKVYAVAGGTKEAPTANILVSPNSTIKSIADLKWKKFGILAGTIQWRTIVRHILAENGLDMNKDVIIVELAPGLQAQALASRQIDALIALEPISTIIQEKRIGKIIVPGPSEDIIADPFYAGAGIVRVDFAKANPQTTKKVIGVINKAIDEIEKDPQDARKYLKGYTPLTDDVIVNVPMPIFKVCEELNEKDIDAINSFYEIFTLYGVVEGRINIDNLLYCEV